MLHSKYDPRKEAIQLAQKFYKPHHLHIIFGYGLGYVVDALQELMQFEEKIIVFEPMGEQITTFNNVNKNIYIFDEKGINEAEIAIGVLGESARAAFTVICSPNYDKLFPNEFKMLLEKTRGVQYNHTVNDNTLRRFSHQWHTNATRNLLYLEKDHIVDVLEKNILHRL